ncbi:MAG: methyltransferase domain-containing protein [Gaiellaceae bacterium]|jgi:cyclopropane fatty-acyl-phospholipid synthase-like methyltransferase
MGLTREQIHEMMKNESYPLSSKYDPDWIIENQMGSHGLWLMESLTREMQLDPGMRVLDLGCGTAIGSIFLAKELGVQVWAIDLWVDAADNWKRACESGVDDLVYPIHAEAHALPFADGFFDAVVGINSFQFFATDDYYMKHHLAKVVKPGSQIGMIVPGLYEEFDGEIPEYIKPYWDPEFYSWHSPEWWRDHWNRTGLVTVELADTLPEKEGYEIFLKFGLIVDSGDKLLPADEGRNISFVRVIARRW